ncbi:Uncharacterized protein DAT39_014041, partial [Clarias magur]
EPKLHAEGNSASEGHTHADGGTRGVSGSSPSSSSDWQCAYGPVCAFLSVSP